MNLFNKKSLVIYFTHTGENYMSDGIRNIEKGNTEIIAEMIKDITGAELFKVETVKEYPYNYRQCTDVALQEKNENARPELKKYLNNIDEYEVIYIGYPNWWGDMPMPIYTFLDEYNLSGKTIAPFITNGGSGLSGTPNKIKKEEPNAKVTEGLAISGNQAKNSQTDVNKWLTKLGF